ncbi:MAG TPA: PepSY domain-containing protein [Ferruginibacter sp.]|nr:PepSY domain-containing protein [Ferruginibacter sp.]
MASKTTMNNRMRIWHRYLGFFLAGIMFIYALSGIVLIFRDTNFLKQEKTIEKKLGAGLPIEEVGKAIRQRDLKVKLQNGDTLFFAQGFYNTATGEVKYTVKSLVPAMERLTKLHKANTKSPLFYLNVFFGTSLLFFVISSFWMFMPGTAIFKKGLLFVLAGIVLTLVMLWV